MLFPLAPRTRNNKNAGARYSLKAKVFMTLFVPVMCIIVNCFSSLGVIFDIIRRYLTHIVPFMQANIKQMPYGSEHTAATGTLIRFSVFKVIHVLFKRSSLLPFLAVRIK